MKIALDFDEVVVDFMNAMLDYYHKKTGKRYSREDFKSHDWWPVWGITKEEAIRIVNEFHEKSNINDVKPLELALESINNLLKEKHELFVITARPVYLRKKVEDWIKHHIKNSPITVISSGDFHEDQAAPKADICLELGIGLLLEDKRETAVDCAEKGVKVILFDNPWNKNLEHKNIFRVSGWLDAMKKINELSKDPALSLQ